MTAVLSDDQLRLPTAEVQRLTQELMLVDEGQVVQWQQWQDSVHGHVQCTANRAQRTSADSMDIDARAVEASVPLPKMTQTVTRTRQKWDGDLGKIFGKKKTKHYQEQVPRGLTGDEIAAVTNHLRHAIEANPTIQALAGP